MLRPILAARRKTGFQLTHPESGLTVNHPEP
jgi:hypothetical protein